MDIESLNSLGIRQWEQLKSKYENPDLLIGNGFSISLSDNFRYQSLFKTFISKTHEPFSNLFQQFDTTNFELILKFLTSASKVNSILNLPTELIDEAIQELKNGLIESIKEVHPRATDIDWDRIKKITSQLADFGDIYSTNYDLYLYHIIMVANDISREKTKSGVYHDYFWGNSSPGYTQFMPYQELKLKSVHYLHGALFIFNRDIFDLKIKKDEEELIERISSEIQKGNFPLFITEGSGADKLSSIHRSNYLSFCLDKLKEHKKSAVIVYGNSLSAFDSHIVDALRQSNRALVISIYTKDRSEIELKNEKYNILMQFNNYKPEIEFIDSASLFPN
ncbi:MAG: hypothetical protein K0S09_1903 [Sphingobacteriaceae bacterium]|jgi:hypothetical protein|nr:hypothetical protein [Sphingobacteriaceae bacterium]